MEWRMLHQIIYAILNWSGHLLTIKYVNTKSLNWQKTGIIVSPLNPLRMLSSKCDARWECTYIWLILAHTHTHTNHHPHESHQSLWAWSRTHHCASEPRFPSFRATMGCTSAALRRSASRVENYQIDSYNVGNRVWFEILLGKPNGHDTHTCTRNIFYSSIYHLF